MSCGHSVRAETGDVVDRPWHFLRNTKLRLVLLTIAALFFAAEQPVRSGPIQTYLALGDSLAFGQTTPPLQPSYGDQGYVKPYADWLATQNGGTRPNVINLAISGEMSTSFFDGVTPPGWTRAVDANLNYPTPPVSQDSLMLAKLASEKAAGHQVSTISFALGSNDFLYLANTPAFASATATQQQQMVGQAFATLQGNYTHLLTQLRSALPNALILLLDYYNPYAIDPSNPFAQVFTAIALAHEKMIEGEAAAFNARVVDIYTPFVGHEADYTHILDGNIHPTDVGYGVIAEQMIHTSQAPEPGTLALFGLGTVSLAGYGWRRRQRVVV